MILTNEERGPGEVFILLLISMGGAIILISVILTPGMAQGDELTLILASPGTFPISNRTVVGRANTPSLSNQDQHHLDICTA